MKLEKVSIEARHWRIRAGNARHSWRAREGRLLTLTDEAGRIGLGEASPLPGYADETLVAVDEALFDVDERLRGDFDDAGDPARQIADRIAPIASPSVRFAVETALWDLVSRRRGVPLAVLWGAKPGAKVSTATLIDLQTPQTWPAAPRTLKAKVGQAGAWAEEFARLALVRGRYPDVPIRIDVNQAFARDVVEARLADLAGLVRDGLRVEYIEEPSAIWPKASPVPLARDESLRGHRPVEMEPALASTAAVVLKPTILGGLQACRDWVGWGPRAVISHTFEGPIAYAAAVAWALAFAPEVSAGLGPHGGLTAFADFDLALGDTDTLRVPAVPGLGLRSASA